MTLELGTGKLSVTTECSLWSHQETIWSCSLLTQEEKGSDTGRELLEVTQPNQACSLSSILGLAFYKPSQELSLESQGRPQSQMMHGASRAKSEARKSRGGYWRAMTQYG